MQQLEQLDLLVQLGSVGGAMAAVIMQALLSGVGYLTPPQISLFNDWHCRAFFATAV